MRSGAPARELRIVPEPTAEEREAIERVLAAGEAPPPAYASAWRRSGSAAHDSGGEPDSPRAGGV